MTDRQALAAIVAPFLRCAPEEITAQTSLQQSVVGSSIRYHRMFAALESAVGRRLDRASIRTLSDLLAASPSNTNGSSGTNGSSRAASDGSTQARRGPAAAQARLEPVAAQALSVGIDIEAVSEMPEAFDYRAHEFYAATFTPREIAHCLLSDDVRASFAGRFAAKEAIVKADAGYAFKPFNAVEIEADDHGAPRFPGFSISISHAGGMAVAVAIRLTAAR